MLGLAINLSACQGVISSGDQCMPVGDPLQASLLDSLSQDSASSFLRQYSLDKGDMRKILALLTITWGVRCIAQVFNPFSTRLYIEGMHRRGSRR